MGFDVGHCKQNPRIALLTPYNGGNLGDAAIQDALIYNLRDRLPGVEFSGITLNCDNFTQRHGAEAFPLCGNDRAFYGMSYGKVEQPVESTESPAGISKGKGSKLAWIKIAVKQVPVLGQCLKAIYGSVIGGSRELRHCVDGYRFLRTQDLLIVSGGGQLDDEWGGHWAHPYALFKWTALAKIARVPCAMASVGAGKITTVTSRIFLAAALRMSQYRSFRDRHSRELAADLLSIVAKDPVVPDLAFTIPIPSKRRSLPPQSMTARRLVVAISPIAYVKPQRWPQPDQGLYDSYISKMAQVVSDLAKRNYSLILVYSSLGDDQSVIRDLLDKLDDDCRKSISSEATIPRIATWQDFTAAVQDADVLIASRLHSTILGLVSQTPTIAISFDPKVDWVMEDLEMADYLLHIRDFMAQDVIRIVDQLLLHTTALEGQIASYRESIRAISNRQYDRLAALAPPQSCN